MKVLLIAHPSFFVNPEAKEWFARFEANLAGKPVHTFRVDESKLQNFDTFHLFGFGHFELLANLQKQGKKTFCTPAFGPLKKRSSRNRALEICFRALRTFIQRRFPPMDIFYFIRAADRYLPLSDGLGDWGICQDKIQQLPSDPAMAAATAWQSYYSPRNHS